MLLHFVVQSCLSYSFLQSLFPPYALSFATGFMRVCLQVSVLSCGTHVFPLGHLHVFQFVHSPISQSTAKLSRKKYFILTAQRRKRKSDVVPGAPCEKSIIIYVRHGLLFVSAPRSSLQEQSPPFSHSLITRLVLFLLQYPHFSLELLHWNRLHPSHSPISQSTIIGKEDNHFAQSMFYQILKYTQCRQIRVR